MNESIEYNIVDIDAWNSFFNQDGYYSDPLSTILNNQGMDGWELCCPDPGNPRRLIFKRVDKW